MSWSGTVTCSHCYQRGHNKRKCPTLTAQIKDKYEGNVLAGNAARERGDEDLTWYEERAEHYRQQYLKRTKIDLATGEKLPTRQRKLHA
jgi:hypothetical protein